MRGILQGACFRGYVGASATDYPCLRCARSCLLADKQDGVKTSVQRPCPFMRVPGLSRHQPHRVMTASTGISRHDFAGHHPLSVWKSIFSDKLQHDLSSWQLGKDSSRPGVSPPCTTGLPACIRQAAHTASQGAILFNRHSEHFLFLTDVPLAKLWNRTISVS